MGSLIDLDKFDPKDVENVRAFVHFCADIIEVEPLENPDRLRRGIERLGDKADSLYPQLESGEVVKLEAEDVGDWGLPESVAQTFVGLAGNILFLGIDGPRATARQLQRSIDQIAGAVLTQLGAQEALDELDEEADDAPTDPTE